MKGRYLIYMSIFPMKQYRKNKYNECITLKIIMEKNERTIIKYLKQ